MVCSQGTCECFIGDEGVKICPQGDSCKDWLGLDDMESGCCMVR